MTPRLLAQLDRRLARHGDHVTLRRYTGTATARSAIDLDILGIAKGGAEQDTVGGIAQQTYTVIISPTPLIADGWPRQMPADDSRPLLPGSSARLPRRGDRIVVHGVERSIERVSPVFESSACVRIELTATG